MQNLNKQLKNKIINMILKLEKVQSGYQSFFPIIHFEGRNSVIIEAHSEFKVVDDSTMFIIFDNDKRLFFSYREIL